MSIKASKNDLARLLGGAGTSGLIAYDDPNPLPQTIENSKEHGIVLGEDQNKDHHHEPIPLLDGAERQTNSSVAPKTYRSQGLTIYDSDDELLDEFVAYLRKRKMRIGRKKGFSLFARAGLRALEEVRLKNPVAFEEFLVRALHEQK